MDLVIDEASVLFEHKDRKSKQYIVLTEESLFIQGTIKESLLVRGKGTSFTSAKWIVGATKTEVSNFAWLIATILTALIAIYLYSISVTEILIILPIVVSLISLLLYFKFKKRVLLIQTIIKRITIPTRKIRKKELDEFFSILEDLVQRIA